MSSFLGGLVCIIPSALFALRLARAGRRGNDAFGVSFLIGELVKIALTGVLFVLIYKWYPKAEPLPLLVGFIATLHGYLLALLLAR